MPLLAGPPVELDGRRFYDAGLSESVPYRTALAQGATHILVLRSRRDPLVVPDGQPPSRSLRLLARTTLRRETPALRAAFLARDTRLAADDHHLSTHQSTPASTSTPAITPASTSTPAITPTHTDTSTPTITSSPVSPVAPAVPAAPATPASTVTPASAPASSVTSGSGVPVAVFSIRPPPGSPVVSRLATDGRLLREAFESGRAATHATFAP